MSHPAFELLARQPVEALHVVVESWRHRVTGALHLHLAAEDSHNAFLVAFLTVPTDSTGVAHILEHTALCGSRRYPVRDPFFMMLRRSLQTFMNAFTSSDWTAYPFASLSRKDFDNLLDVYLDAAFFPHLSELDFLQEGCRLALEGEGEAAALQFKGVVYNEMKGAMSSPSRVLWERLCHHLFPTVTYHHNSGGDPACIPDLTWKSLTEFHRAHYHPSNAVFMTYGDIPAAQHQQRFETQVLQSFSAPGRRFHVDLERPLAAPVRVSETYAIEADGTTARRTHVVMGWLWGMSTDLESLLKAHLLSGVLLDNSASPLLHALETSPLGSAPSPLCGLDDSGRQMVFTCGLEGSEAESADAVEAMILEVLQQVAREGVPRERVEAVLHQIELSRREVSGDGMPYGLKLMLTALPAALHQGDPLAVLALDPVLERLRVQVLEPDFIPAMVQELLLRNDHRVRLTLIPDPGLAARRDAEEAARLQALRAAQGPGDLEAIARRDEALAQRQQQEDDPDVLPRVTLADVPATLAIPRGQKVDAAGMEIHEFDRPTNGLVYQQLVLDLPDLEPELLDLLPLYTGFLSELGSGGRDYRETQALQSLVTGGVGVRAAVHGAVEGSGSSRGAVVVSSRALHRNHVAMGALLADTFDGVTFAEGQRIRELLSQTRLAAEHRVPDHGHALALSAASASMNSVAALGESWGGMPGVRRLRALDEVVRGDDAALGRLQERLVAIGAALRQAPSRWLLVGEGRQLPEYRAALTDLWSARRGAVRVASMQLPPPPPPRRVGWIVNSGVNFCARVYPAVAYDHPDAPLLTVLGRFLFNNHLHRAIRERGGAYGSGAGYDADTCAFRFHSYRDPRLEGTLSDFDASVVWFLEREHAPRLLEEAILGVVGSIDRPGSPAGEAKRAFFDGHFGKTPERRIRFRNRVLEATLPDLARVARAWLDPARAITAVVGNEAALRGARAALNLELETLAG
ncbi:MAG: insulinase family protein [Magnetococcus sp. WYHC-3]